MKCSGCGKQTIDHEKFYVFQMDFYYPSGGTSDLALITSDPTERVGHYDYDEVIYVCNGAIYDFEGGKEIGKELK